MAIRTEGKQKLTGEMRAKLAELAMELRALAYGEAGCPEWGTSFAEIECDAKELGHEVMRQMMEQVNAAQSESCPDAAWVAPTGESVLRGPSEPRTLLTESGPVTWNEPKAYLPKSRKAFFPSESGLGPEGG